jgi:hypothetical protein
MIERVYDVSVRCGVCGGTGTVRTPVRGVEATSTPSTFAECPTCKGSGVQRVTVRETIRPDPQILPGPAPGWTWPWYPSPVWPSPWYSYAHQDTQILPDPASNPAPDPTSNPAPVWPLPWGMATWEEKS